MHEIGSSILLARLAASSRSSAANGIRRLALLGLFSSRRQAHLLLLPHRRISRGLTNLDLTALPPNMSDDI